MGAPIPSSFVGSSKVIRTLDHVPLIESEPPAPKTDALSDAYQKQTPKLGDTSPLAAVAKPFVLMRSIAPIPAKLVAKIHGPPECNALPFVAMRELLPDNIALMKHLEVLPGAAGGSRDMLQQREVPSLLTWVASFVMYVAIVAEKRPEKGQTPLGIHVPTNLGGSASWGKRLGEL